MTARLDWTRYWAEGVWRFPDQMNMAEQACDAWAASEPERVAILEVDDGAVTRTTYGALRDLSYRVQTALAERGVQAGDRVGVLLAQSPLCAAAHIAIWRMGAISVPLFKLFAEGALRSRVEDSGAQHVVTDAEGTDMLAPLGASALTLADLPQAPAPCDAAPTGPETPAVLIYTSGTTGKPKGALHGHRVLTGHLPGVIVSHNTLGSAADDVIWTPADWAWIGGLFDVAMPGLALGVPVVAARLAKFTPDAAQRICAACDVRNVFFPPTALRMLKAADLAIPGLRSIASGGEPLGPEMQSWGKDAFGRLINEFYGQTECNMVVSACTAFQIPPRGAIGGVVQGHDVAVIDDQGKPTEAEGDIAVRRGSPSMMLEYWQNPQATAEKFRGDWLLTGDRGRKEGPWVYFVGRDDDVITSAGYRIGPAEIEDCLLTHPGVATVGVVGKPDSLRTEIVKAYVVRKEGANPSAEELRSWVKERLATYSYPREISFLDALPMTVTGKVIRKELKARAAAEDAE